MADPTLNLHDADSAEERGIAKPMNPDAPEESARLQRLYELELLDTEAEPEFDELVQLASAICETPVSLMNLLDINRQWFKAAVGTDLRELPLEIAFCTHAIQGPDLFVIEDATKDDRFAHNPVVTGDPKVRFYAGMPLDIGDGCRVGTLCVLDIVPRHLLDSQKKALTVLARQVSMRLEMRLRRKALIKLLSDKEEMAQQLQASERKFRSFMDHGPFLSYMKTEDGRYDYYNAHFAEVFNTDQQAWLGTRDIDHFNKEQADAFRANDIAVITSGKPAVVIETTLAQDGSTIWWQSHKFPCRDAHGGMTLGGVSVNLTEEYRREIELQTSKLELEELNAQLKMLTLTDALTGLKNRRAFESRLSLEFLRAKRTESYLTLVMLDIDFFKRVNDELGHAAGDEVLCEVADALQASVRNTDMASRFGGEEFAVILTETDASGALLWTKRLEDMMAKKRWKHRTITLSMGIAELCEEVLETAEIVQRADEALYAAKRAGRARSVIFGAQPAPVAPLRRIRVG